MKKLTLPEKPEEIYLKINLLNPSSYNVVSPPFMIFIIAMMHKVLKNKSAREQKEFKELKPYQIIYVEHYFQEIEKLLKEIKNHISFLKSFNHNNADWYQHCYEDFRDDLITKRQMVTRRSNHGKLQLQEFKKDIQHLSAEIEKIIKITVKQNQTSHQFSNG